MKPFLFDSGVFLAARDRDDPFHQPSRDLIAATVDVGRPRFALDLTLLEVVNVATVRWKSAAEATRLEGLVVAVAERIARVEVDYAIGQVAQLATQESISVYDAAYALCARRHGWELVSTDVRDLVSRGLALDPSAAGAVAGSADEGPDAGEA